MNETTYQMSVRYQKRVLKYAHMCLSFDEIKIKENLVLDKYTGKLLGFVDLGNEILNSTFENSNKVALHVMVSFYVLWLVLLNFCFHILEQTG